MPDLPSISFEWLPLGPFDSHLWWLLIGLCVALLITVQSVETAVDGAWPNQRRPTSYLPRARAVQAGWGVVALLLIPGALLAIGNVAITMWQDIARTDAQVLGGWLLAIAWVAFIMGSRNVLGARRVLDVIGITGTVLLLALLLIADVLLLSALLDILPEREVLEDGIRDGLNYLIPFLGD